MTFAELLAEIQKLKCEERRSKTEEYLEVVILKEGLEPLNRILTVYFGPPFKPEGVVPLGAAEWCAKPYGGIRKDQTMYFRQDADHSECALLWPWGNGSRVTAKIIRDKRIVSKNILNDLLGNLFVRK